MLRNLPSKEQWSKEPTGIKLLLGTITETTCPPLDYQMTGSFSSSKSGKTIKSESVRATLDCVAQSSWLNEQTQDLMQINDLHSFYNANLEDTMLLTHPQNHKQQ